MRARRPVADRRLRVSHSRVARLPGAQIVDFAAYRRDLIASSPRPAIARRLVDIYGTRAQPILAMIAQHDELGRVVDEESGVTAAELAFALSEESAVTLADVVARRVMTGLDASMGLDSLQDIGRAVQSLAGWSDEQLGREIDGYHDYVAKFHPRAISAR